MPAARRDFRCGIIEGFYGTPWSWEARADYATFLAQNGFDFYIYAPKADARLRKLWREDWSAAEWDALGRLRADYRQRGVGFGIGLTPYGAQADSSAEVRAALRRKLARIDELEPDLLAVLFDDVPGIVADLAERQVAIAHDAGEATRASSLLFCPTYYSDDPVLASMLGAMPSGYLEALGKGLDREIEIFWTGPRICSREYTRAHLGDVAGRLGRKPFLWDNYPVNDGPRMCRHLHLRPVVGRSPELREATSGLAANPMNQPQLSKIPLLSLRESLATRRGAGPEAAFRRASHAVCGPALAERLEQDLALLHDEGLDALEPARRTELRACYAAFDEPCAREVVAWLDGDFEPSAEVLAEFAGYNV